MFEEDGLRMRTVRQINFLYKKFID